MPRIAPSSSVPWRLVPQPQAPPRAPLRHPSAAAAVPPPGGDAPGAVLAVARELTVREAVARWLSQVWSAGCRLITLAIEAQAAESPMAWGSLPSSGPVLTASPASPPTRHATSPLIRFGGYASLPRQEIGPAQAAELTCPICLEPAENLHRPVAVVHPGGINVYEHQELMEYWRRSRLHWPYTPDKLPCKTLYRLVIVPAASVGAQRPGGRDDVLGLRQDGAL